jgi:tellurite resistance protein TerC
MWIVFGVTMAVLLAIDLFAHRGSHGEGRKSAIVWSVIWIGAGLAFNVFVWITLGGYAAKEYLAAYAIEKSLSVDNLFVFLVIFRSLGVPKEKQQTVLTWGVLGALALRALFIMLGVAAIEKWDWVVYIFGGILFFAAYHAFREDPTGMKESKLVAWLSRQLPVTEQYVGSRFFTRRNGRLVATPLFVAVIAVEATDVMFAIDSVPAALSVTRERFLVYSSNAFAILGLRALFVVLARTIAQMKYLHYGLAFVLALAGAKMIASDFFHVPPLLSVGLIVLAIGSSVYFSVRARRRNFDDQNGKDVIADDTRSAEG